MIVLKKIKLEPDQKFFILTILTGLAAGIIAILLHKSIHFLMMVLGTHGRFTLKSFLLGGLSLFLGGFICTKYMPVLSGSGIPRTKILISVHRGIIHTKEWLLKALATVLCLASGVPLGSEGPTIAISAGVGSGLGQLFSSSEKHIKSLVFAGCSAGIAAAFNTPIAAVIFTMEEVIGSSSAKSMGPILISSVVASVTAASLVGQNSIFTPVHYHFDSSKELIFYLGLGLVSGISGPLFMKNIIGVKQITKKYFKHHRLTPLMASFLMVGGISYYLPDILGSGLPVINDLLQGKMSSPEQLGLLILLKFLACAVCFGSGMSGGVLMPVLFLGAALGGLFGSISTQVLGLEQMEMGAYCLVGMGAFFASVIKTPFTSIILVFEMTRDYRIVMPLMLASLVSYFLSERISKGTIYDKVADSEGYELPSHDEEDHLSHSTVEEVYRKISDGARPSADWPRIYPDQSLSHAISKIKQHSGKPLKVVSRMNSNEVLGEIRLEDVLKFLGLEHL